MPRNNFIPTRDYRQARSPAFYSPSPLRPLSAAFSSPSAAPPLTLNSATVVSSILRTPMSPAIHVPGYTPALQFRIVPDCVEIVSTIVIVDSRISSSRDTCKRQFASRLEQSFTWWNRMRNRVIARNRKRGDRRRVTLNRGAAN